MTTIEGYGWLIEAPGPAYLAARKLGGYEFYWTADHNKAIRFHDQAIADNTMMAIRQLCPNIFPAAMIREPKPVEHGWLASPPSSPVERRTGERDAGGDGN